MVRCQSFSALEQYTNCGKSFELSRVKGLPALTAAWFTQGTAEHTALEDWERSDRVINPVERFFSEYDTGISEQLEAHPDEHDWLRGGRKSRERDIAERRERGAEQVAAYTAWAERQPWRVWKLPDESLALEVPFTVDLGGGQQVTGYIDAVWEWESGAVEPVDYKSGTKKPEHPRQLGIYRVALMETFGLTVTHGRFVMLKDLSCSPVDVRRYDKAYLAELYGAAKRGIAAGVFLPRPSNGCFTCTVKPHCREAV